MDAGLTNDDISRVVTMYGIKVEPYRFKVRYALQRANFILLPSVDLIYNKYQNPPFFSDISKWRYTESQLQCTNNT